MAYVADRGELADAGVAGPPQRLARSLQVGGHEVRDLKIRGVRPAGMPGPGRGSIGIESSLGHPFGRKQLRAGYCVMCRKIRLSLITFQPAPPFRGFGLSPTLLRTEVLSLRER